jgi:hypothetical protein
MFAKLKDWRRTSFIIFYLNEWLLNLAVAAGEEVHPPAHERDPRPFDGIRARL